MNDYIVTQQDIELLMQSSKTLFYKLELLDEKYNVVDLIEGNLISDNISITSESDVRRTYNCELLVTDSTFVLGRDSKIWFNKMIRPYIGVLHQRTNQIKYYLLGTFLFTELNYNFDPITKRLSLTCVDMMSLLNDTRKGQMPVYKRTILKGTDARTVIANLLQEASITKYFIEFNINGQSLSTFEIPHDMVFEAGTSIYSMIKEIVDLYPGTQMYFSSTGVFVINRIPTNKNEINVLTDDIIQPILINEQISTTLTNVYNHIKIYGKVNTPDYFTKEVTVSGNSYKANIITVKLDEDTNASIEIPYDEYDNFDVIALRIPTTNRTNQTININNLGEIPIVNSDNKPLPENYLDANSDCVFRYRDADENNALNNFLYVGQYQCYGEAWLTNNVSDTNKYAVIDKESDFAIEVIGERLKVLTGESYDKIPTNSACEMRARKELYEATNLTESINISTIAIPFLDVNQKIQFTPNSTKETHEYIVTNISCDYSTYEMAISLSRFYPSYI